MSGARDPRLTPARPDLAAASLEGAVEAERFVAGERRIVRAPLADIRRRPRLDAPLETQASHGEAMTLYEDEEGWGWVQLETDGYVGYVLSHEIGPAGPEPTHVVRVGRTFVYPAPDMKQPPLAALPLGARVAIGRVVGDYASLADGGFIHGRHLAACADPETDFVAVAERFLGAPYLWGGRSPLGVDCSALVQLALARAGHAAPRDTDMQEKALGEAIAFDATLAGLRRGDLVFWRGHVGIMRDAEILLHANGHHMLVAEEPLPVAMARILANAQAPLTSVRRITIT